MSLYKVMFKDNLAVSGESISPGLYDDIKEFGTDGTTTFIKWYIVHADSETEAIKIANKVVREIWGTILGLWECKLKCVKPFVICSFGACPERTYYKNFLKKFRHPPLKHNT